MSSQSALRRSGLEPEDQEFCSALADFCCRFDISLSRLREMVRGEGEETSRTTVHRILLGQVTPGSLNRFRPIISSAIVRFLEEQMGYSPEQIEIEFTSNFLSKEILKMIASRCPLSPEAIKFFGLKRDPFDVDQLPYGDEVFTNAELDAIAARVRDAVKYQRFIAVVGGVGTGKTLLKLRVATELADDGKTALIYPEFFDMEQVTVAGIATQILAALDQKVPQDKTRRVNRIKEVLTQMQQEGIAVAIIIDEAHRLHDKVISSFKNFWELTNGRNNRLLGVLLFGQPSFVDSRLRDIRFKEIRQRIQIIQMPELNGQSEAYLRHRITLAGGDLDKLFDPEAVRRVTLNGVTPLALGNLANAALMDAFAQEEPRVTSSLPFFKKLNTGQQVLGIRRTAA